MVLGDAFKVREPFGFNQRRKLKREQKRQASQARGSFVFYVIYDLNPCNIWYSLVSKNTMRVLVKEKDGQHCREHSSGENKRKPRTIGQQLEITWRKGFSDFLWRSLLHTSVLYVVSFVDCQMHCCLP